MLKTMILRSANTPPRAHAATTLKRRQSKTTISWWFALAAFTAAMIAVAGSSHATDFGLTANAPDDGVISVGADEFTIDTQRGPVTVYTRMPQNFSASSPILIVMPGTRRDAYRHLAFDYFDTWDGLADEMGALLLVPEFTAERWPGSWSYQTGNIRTPDLRPIPWEQTAFNAVERAFQTAVQLTGSNQRTFDIFGHGGGAQFVQRYVLHSGGRMIGRAIAANPGWYMLPDDEYMFPYGLGGAPISQSTLRRAFATDFVLLLGTADTNHARPLRTNALTRPQGKNRYERGYFYFNRSQAQARRIGANFNWRLREVPGVAHDQKRMGPPAAALFATSGR